MLQVYMIKRIYNNYIGKIMQRLYIDYKDQYFKSCQQPRSDFEIYFSKTKAYDTYPGRKYQQYCIYQPDGIGSIYQPLFAHLSQIVQFPISFTQPSLLIINYLKKVNHIHKQYYGQQNVNFIEIFGSEQQKYVEFWNNYINKQPSLNDKQLINKYKQNSEKAIKLFLRNRLYNEELLRNFNLLVTRTLKYLPAQSGDQRLQPVLKMVRQLQSTYEFSLSHKPQSREDRSKKILIKSALKRKSHMHVRESKKNFTQLDDLIDRKVKRSYNKQNCLILLNQAIPQILQQLLEYQFMAGQPYPRLHPGHIMSSYKRSQTLYFHNLDFSLSISPIIIQSLGFYQRIYSKNLSQDQQNREQNMNRDFSIEGLVVSTPAKLILIINYIQNCELTIGKFDRSQIYKKSQWQRVMKTQKYENMQGLTQRQQYKISSQSILQIPTVNNALPTLYQIDQYFKLNCHISDISESRHEHVLSLRYKIIQFFITSIKQIQSSLKVIDQLILCLVGLQFRDILRLEEQKMKSHVNYNIKFCEGKQFIDEISNLGDNLALTSEEKNKIMGQTLRKLPNQIKYVYRQDSCNLHNEKLHLNYGKYIKMFALAVLSKPNRNLLQDKSLQLQWVVMLRYIVYKLILVMDHENIFWCEQLIYQKILNLFGKHKGQEEVLQKLKQVKSQLQKRANSYHFMWWGIQWKY